MASNSSGSTPKELFEDVYEELDKQVRLLHSKVLMFIFMNVLSFLGSTLGLYFMDASRT